MQETIKVQVSPEFLEKIIRDEVRAFLEGRELDLRQGNEKEEYTRKEFLELAGMSWNKALETFWFNEDFKPLRYKRGHHERAPWFVSVEGLSWFKNWEKSNLRG
ncbi:hypothetical protein [Listeria monocytogenes]|uniref:hypothetical protein n=1 Tax=Listeria monocytogenes TaxID=1639 RepID=UPI0011EC8814|nr:hypothetical protein [Listeria monocytogenes]EAV9864488.1 hypothetical protein [Listeria monocytogenes]TYU25376.1 hypothetical protein FZW91_02515 [Listeria monocytogenes]TYU32115.1 hypothetical protein FZW87_14060 [Listeria monocytogenes]